jgi:hypothetical protein
MRLLLRHDLRRSFIDPLSRERANPPFPDFVGDAHLIRFASHAVGVLERRPLTAFQGTHAS